MDWTQALTIMASIAGMMLWSSRERRADYLYTMKIIDEIRKDVLNFNTKMALQDLEFKTRLAAIEQGKKK